MRRHGFLSLILAIILLAACSAPGTPAPAHDAPAPTAPDPTHAPPPAPTPFATPTSPVHRQPTPTASPTATAQPSPTATTSPTPTAEPSPTATPAPVEHLGVDSNGNLTYTYPDGTTETVDMSVFPGYKATNLESFSEKDLENMPEETRKIMQERLYMLGGRAITILQTENEKFAGIIVWNSVQYVPLNENSDFAEGQPRSAVFLTYEQLGKLGILKEIYDNPKTVLSVDPTIAEEKAKDGKLIKPVEGELRKDGKKLLFFEVPDGTRLVLIEQKSGDVYDDVEITRFGNGVAMVSENSRLDINYSSGNVWTIPENSRLLSNSNKLQFPIIELGKSPKYYVTVGELVSWKAHASILLGYGTSGGPEPVQVYPSNLIIKNRLLVGIVSP